MSDHFRVHPDSLARLAEDFRAAAGELGEATQGFGGNVMQVGQAFGLLGVCDGIAGKYLEMTEHTVQGLGQLAELLDANAQGLERNRESYCAVDAAHARAMGGN